MPPAEATPRVNPAHNGEALTVCLEQGRDNRRRAMPWEALCLLEPIERYGPVTTDPFGVRLRSCHSSGKSTAEAIRGLSGCTPEMKA